MRLLAQRGYLKPRNKKEFAAFRQKTLLLGDETFYEDKPDAFLEKHAELNFEDWPEFNVS